MTEKKSLTKKQKRIAALVGVALGLICHALPPDYQGPCKTLIQVCTGGF